MLLGLPAVAAARCVAAYASFGTEPATDTIVRRLTDAGTRVLLPVLCDDLDLDWAESAGSVVLVARRAGSPLREPAGPLLGADAIAAADVVIVPALAVDRQGVRLGRGGGSYDRALRRTRTGAPLVALVYDGEVVDRLPVEAHDVRVDAAVTPSGVHRLRVRR